MQARKDPNAHLTLPLLMCTLSDEDYVFIIQVSRGAATACCTMTLTSMLHHQDNMPKLIRFLVARSSLKKGGNEVAVHCPHKARLESFANI
jgi:hypothetical protein